MDKPSLSIPILIEEANSFAQYESSHNEPILYGVTDGKAVGTYLEHKFRTDLLEKYAFARGNSASGIDFPELGVDMKVTSFMQPQSSCPFKSARQKIYGLGYSLLIFVYEKSDDHLNKTGCLNMRHVIFVDSSRTADFQLTSSIRQILSNNGNKDDILALLQDRNLPIEEMQADFLANEILRSVPEQGYITMSNALQWRLQYARVIAQAGSVDGIRRVL
jgi:hypothetical protein